jgi:hypothetical protein
MDANKIIGVWALGLLAIVIIGPILVLWSLNTLFPSLNIQYTLETWSAVVLIHGACRTTITKNIK